MKRLFRIFELSKSEQRVVLIVTLILVTIAFAGYVRRVNRFHVGAATASEMKTSPPPGPTQDEQ
jgi:hypothetical protein